MTNYGLECNLKFRRYGTHSNDIINWKLWNEQRGEQLSLWQTRRRKWHMLFHRLKLSIIAWNESPYFKKRFYAEMKDISKCWKLWYAECIMENFKEIVIWHWELSLMLDSTFWRKTKNLWWKLISNFDISGELYSDGRYFFNIERNTIENLPSFR